MGDAFLYDGKQVEVDGQRIKVPKFSEWRDVCECGCFHVAYFPEIKKYFLNDWESDIPSAAMSILVVLLIFAFELWSVCINWSGTTRLSLVVVGSFLHFFWALSHVEAMCASPGYLPWFWSVEQRRTYSRREKWSGVITNKEQYNFAVRGVCPERAIVSQSGRRIVLRADLNCGWINNWVGVGNYRYFLVMLLWLFAVFVYYFVVFAFDVYAIKREGWRMTAPRIAFFVTIIPVVVVFVYFAIFAFRVLRNLMRNETRVFEDQAGNPYDIGDVGNCQEAFGPLWCSPFYCFPLPFPTIRDGFRWPRNDNQQSSYEMVVRDAEVVAAGADDYAEQTYDGEGVGGEKEENEYFLPPITAPKPVGQQQPRVLLEEQVERSDDYLFVVEYSDAISDATEATQQSFLLSSGVMDISDSLSDNKEIEKPQKPQKITVSGQPLHQTLPTPKKEKHRVRKTKIGPKPAVHPQPPGAANTDFPKLEPYIPRRSIEMPQKDGPIRFFVYK